MDPTRIAIAGFVALFALMLLRVPVGIAMGLVGVGGFGDDERRHPMTAIDEPAQQRVKPTRRGAAERQRSVGKNQNDPRRTHAPAPARRIETRSNDATRSAA